MLGEHSKHRAGGASVYINPRFTEFITIFSHMVFGKDVLVSYPTINVKMAYAGIYCHPLSKRYFDGLSLVSGMRSQESHDWRWSPSIIVVRIVEAFGQVVRLFPDIVCKRWRAGVAPLFSISTLTAAPESCVVGKTGRFSEYEGTLNSFRIFPLKVEYEKSEERECQCGDRGEYHDFADTFLKRKILIMTVFLVEVLNACIGIYMMNKSSDLLGQISKWQLNLLAYGGGILSRWSFGVFWI